MALQLTDYLPVNRDDAGTVTAYKTQVNDIVGLVPATSTPTLDEVAKAGDQTTESIQVGDLTADDVTCDSSDLSW